MTTTHDDVRAAAKEVLSSNGIYSTHTVKALARFVDAVLNPPPDVAEAMRWITTVGNDPVNDQTLSRHLAFRELHTLNLSKWIVSILTPAAKETT